MPKYAYKAKSKKGQIKSGEVSAASKQAAKTLLSNKGLRILKLTATAADLGDNSKLRGLSRFIYRDKNGNFQVRLGAQLPTTRELGLFTKQFSLMIENGIPMLQALQMLRDQQRKVDFGKPSKKSFVPSNRGRV